MLLLRKERLDAGRQFHGSLACATNVVSHRRRTLVAGSEEDNMEMKVGEFKSLKGENSELFTFIIYFWSIVDNVCLMIIAHEDTLKMEEIAKKYRYKSTKWKAEKVAKLQNVSKSPELLQCVIELIDIVLKWKPERDILAHGAVLDFQFPESENVPILMSMETFDYIHLSDLHMAKARSLYAANLAKHVQSILMTGTSTPNNAKPPNPQIRKILNA